MRRFFVLMCIFALAGMSSAACTRTQYRPEYVRDDPRPSFAEAQGRTKAYLKKAALAPQDLPTGSFAGQVDDLFSETLAAVIQARANRLQLLTPRETGFPEFMRDTTPFAAPEAFHALAETARLEGYHHLLRAAVLHVRASERKTGIWWFRKTRYFMTVAVAVDVYDTFTAAKISSHVKEKTVKIDAGDYEAYQSGVQNNITAVDKAVAGMARDMGRQAARVILSTPWKAVVAAVHAERIELAAGRAVGLQVGDRWDVYEGRRKLEGYDGARFIVPGYKVGTIELTAVEDASAQARADGNADIRAGDIAVPTR
jgi:hypothetical protein